MKPPPDPAGLRQAQCHLQCIQGSSMLIQDSAVNGRGNFARDIRRHVPAALVDRTSSDRPTREAGVKRRRSVRNMVIPVTDRDSRTTLKMSRASKQVVLIELVTELRALAATMPTLRIQLKMIKPSTSSAVRRPAGSHASSSPGQSQGRADKCERTRSATPGKSPCPHLRVPLCGGATPPPKTCQPCSFRRFPS